MPNDMSHESLGTPELRLQEWQSKVEEDPKAMGTVHGKRNYEIWPGSRTLHSIGSETEDMGYAINFGENMSPHTSDLIHNFMGDINNSQTGFPDRTKPGTLYVTFGKPDESLFPKDSKEQETARELAAIIGPDRSIIGLQHKFLNADENGNPIEQFEYVVVSDELADDLEGIIEDKVDPGRVFNAFTALLLPDPSMRDYIRIPKIDPNDPDNGNLITADPPHFNETLLSTIAENPSAEEPKRKGLLNRVKKGREHSPEKRGLPVIRREITAESSPFIEPPVPEEATKKSVATKFIRREDLQIPEPPHEEDETTPHEGIRIIEPEIEEGATRPNATIQGQIPPENQTNPEGINFQPSWLIHTNDEFKKLREGELGTVGRYIAILHLGGGVDHISLNDLSTRAITWGEQAVEEGDDVWPELVPYLVRMRNRIKNMSEEAPSAQGKRTEHEKKIFGESDAFSLRWTRLHRIPDIIKKDASIGVPRDFVPAELLTTIYHTGFATDPLQPVLSSSTERDFETAATAGLIPLLKVNHAMESARIDTVAKALTEGPTPKGIGQWLIKDQETRRALALILRLQGYRIPPVQMQIVKDRNGRETDYQPVLEDGNFIPLEKDKNGNPIYDPIPQTIIEWVDEKEKIIKNPTPEMIRRDKLRQQEFAFADVNRTNHEQIERYLEEIRKTIKPDAGTDIGTDIGVVRLAYTIFRIMGFPHENNKFISLINDYSIQYSTADKKVGFTYKTKDKDQKDVITGKNTNPDGDLNADKRASDLAPFLEDEDGKNETTLATNGIIGFATSLNDVKAEMLARYWSDTQLMLDMMDKIADIRSGTGGASTMPTGKRLEAVRGLQELATLLAKRKLGNDSAKKILDHAKISQAPPAGEPTALQKELAALRSLLGFIPRKPRPLNKKR